MIGPGSTLESRMRYHEEAASAALETATAQMGSHKAAAEVMVTQAGIAIASVHAQLAAHFFQRTEAMHARMKGSLDDDR